MTKTTAATLITMITKRTITKTSTKIKSIAMIKTIIIKFNTIEKKQLETLGLDMESILQVFKNDLDSSSIEYKKLCENINNFYGSTTEKYQLSF